MGHDDLEAGSPRLSGLEKVACGAFCAYPLRCAIPAARKPRVAILATRSTRCVSPLDGTLRVDLRSTKRAPARLCAYTP